MSDTVLILTENETAALTAINEGASVPHRSSLVRYALPYLSHYRSHKARILASELSMRGVTPELKARIERGLPAPARAFTGTKYPGKACVCVTGWRDMKNFGAQRTVPLDSLDASSAVHLQDYADARAGGR